MFLFNFNRLYTFTRFELRRPRTSMIRLERGGAWGIPAGLEDAIDHGHIGDLNIHPSAPGSGAMQLQRISTAG
jgi:hypothetical protein